MQPYAFCDKTAKFQLTETKVAENNVK